MTTLGARNIRRSLFTLLGLAVSSFGLYAFTSPVKASGKGITCALQQLTDSQKSGLVAFTYFVPDGWKSQSSITWNGDSFVAEFLTTTPDKQYGVDNLQPMFISYSAATGTQTHGLRLTNGTDFLHAIVNRMKQQNGISNVEVVEEFNTELPLTETQKMMSQMRQIGGMSQSIYHDSAYLKIKFEKDGVQEVASLGTTIAGALSSNHMSIGYGPSASSFNSESGSYVVGPTLVVVTPASPSATKIKETQIVTSTVKMTPKFSEYCSELALAMSKAALNATIEKGKQQIEDMRESSAKSMANFRARMADKDASTHDFCNYILDQQDYKTPGGSIVTLPTAYNHAWANGQGQYILTDDPTYDPRGTGSGSWQQMQKSVHGQ